MNMFQFRTWLAGLILGDITYIRNCHLESGTIRAKTNKVWISCSNLHSRFTILNYKDELIPQSKFMSK